MSRRFAADRSAFGHRDAADPGMREAIAAPGRRRPVRRRPDDQRPAAARGAAAGQGGGALSALRDDGQPGGVARAHQARRRGHRQPRKPHGLARNRRRGGQRGRAAHRDRRARRVHRRRIQRRVQTAWPHRLPADDAGGYREHAQPRRRSHLSAGGSRRRVRRRARTRHRELPRWGAPVECRDRVGEHASRAGRAVRSGCRGALQGPGRAGRLAARRFARARRRGGALSAHGRGRHAPGRHFRRRRIVCARRATCSGSPRTTPTPA